jgi:hypothetical protein
MNPNNARLNKFTALAKYTLQYILGKTFAYLSSLPTRGYLACPVLEISMDLRSLWPSVCASVGTFSILKNMKAHREDTSNREATKGSFLNSRPKL